MPFWKLFSSKSAAAHREQEDANDPCRVAALDVECENLRGRLRASEQTLRERTEALYEVQQHYSSEHFGFGEAAQLLKIERLRNAGAYAQRDVILERATQLQARIASLKTRLRGYETVEDLYFDTAPLVNEEQP